MEAINEVNSVLRTVRDPPTANDVANTAINTVSGVARTGVAQTTDTQPASIAGEQVTTHTNAANTLIDPTASAEKVVNEPVVLEATPVSAPIPTSILPDNVKQRIILNAGNWDVSQNFLTTIAKIDLTDTLNDQIAKSFPGGFSLTTTGFVKFDMKFLLEVTAPRTVAGCLGMFVLPAGMDVDAPAVSGLGRIGPFAAQTMCDNGLSSILNLMDSGSVELVYPFTSILNAYELPMTAGSPTDPTAYPTWEKYLNRLGTLYIVVWNNLTFNDGGGSVPYRVSCTLENIWAGPTRTRRNFATNPIQEAHMLSMLGEVAGEMVGGPLGAMAGSVVGGLGDAVLTHTGENSTTFTPADNEIVNRARSGNTRPVEPTAFRGDDLKRGDRPFKDEMTHVKDIASRYARVHVALSNTDDPIGKVLWTQKLDYYYVVNGTATDTGSFIAPSNLTAVANMFDMVTGGSVWKFQFVGNKMTQLRVLLAFDPNGRDTLTFDEAQGLPRCDMVFAENSTYEVRVPYINEIGYTRMTEFVDRPRDNHGSLHLFSYGAPAPFGAELPDSYAINIYVKAGEDFDMKLPTLHPRFLFGVGPENVVQTVDAHMEQVLPQAGNVRKNNWHQDHGDIGELVSKPAYVQTRNVPVGESFELLMPVTATYNVTAGSDAYQVRPSHYQAIREMFYAMSGNHQFELFVSNAVNRTSNISVERSSLDTTLVSAGTIAGHSFNPTFAQGNLMSTSNVKERGALSFDAPQTNPFHSVLAGRDGNGHTMCFSRYYVKNRGPYTFPCEIYSQAGSEFKLHQFLGQRVGVYMDVLPSYPTTANFPLPATVVTAHMDNGLDDAPADFIDIGGMPSVLASGAVRTCPVMVSNRKGRRKCGAAFTLGRAQAQHFLQSHPNQDLNLRCLTCSERLGVSGLGTHACEMMKLWFCKECDQVISYHGAAKHVLNSHNQCWASMESKIVPLHEDFRISRPLTQNAHGVSDSEDEDAAIRRELEIPTDCDSNDEQIQKDFKFLKNFSPHEPTSRSFLDEAKELVDETRDAIRGVSSIGEAAASVSEARESLEKLTEEAKPAIEEVRGAAQQARILFEHVNDKLKQFSSSSDAVKRKASSFARERFTSNSFLLRWTTHLVTDEVRFPRFLWDFFCELADLFPVDVGTIYGWLCERAEPIIRSTKSAFDSLFRPSAHGSLEGGLAFGLALPVIIQVVTHFLGSDNPLSRFFSCRGFSDLLRTSLSSAQAAKLLVQAYDAMFPKETPFQAYRREHADEFRRCLGAYVAVTTTPQNQILADSKLMHELRQLKPFLEEFHKLLPTFARHEPGVQEHSVPMISLLRKLVLLFKGARDAVYPKPISLVFAGPSGSGKTLLAQNHFKILMEKEMGYEQSVYPVPKDRENRKDGMAGETIMLYDDVESKYDVDDLGDYLNVMSPGRTILTAAEMEDKGTAIMAETVVLTMNHIKPALRNHSHKDAVYRRMYENFYVVKAKANYCKNGRLDPSKINGVNPDYIWEFQRVRYEGDNTFIFGDKAKLREIVADVASQVKNSRAIAEELADKEMAIGDGGSDSSPVSTESWESSLRSLHEQTRSDRSRSRRVQNAHMDTFVLPREEVARVNQLLDSLFENPKMKDFNVVGDNDVLEYAMERYVSRSAIITSRISALATRTIPNIDFDAADLAGIPTLAWRPHHLPTRTIWFPKCGLTADEVRVLLNSPAAAPYFFRSHPLWRLASARHRGNAKLNIRFFDDVDKIDFDRVDSSLFADVLTPKCVAYWSSVETLVGEESVPESGYVYYLVPIAMWLIRCGLLYYIGRKMTGLLATVADSFTPVKKPPVLPPELPAPKPTVTETFPDPEPAEQLREVRLNPDGTYEFPDEQEPLTAHVKYGATARRGKRVKPKTSLPQFAKTEAGVTESHSGDVDGQTDAVQRAGAIFVKQNGVRIRAFNVCSTVYVLPRHFFQEIAEGELITVFRPGKNRMFKKYEIPFLESRLATAEEGFDLAAYNVGNTIPQGKDLRHLICNSDRIRQTEGKTGQVSILQMCSDEGAGYFSYGLPTIFGAYNAVRNSGLENDGLAFNWTSLVPSRNGYCGSPWLVSIGDKRLVCGIHSAGTDSSSCAVPITLEWVEDALRVLKPICWDNYRSLEGTPEQQVPEDAPGIGDCVYNEVYAHNKGYVPRRTTDYRRSPIYGRVKAKLEGYGPSVLRPSDPRGPGREAFYSQVFMKGDHPQRFYRDPIWLKVRDSVHQRMIPMIVPTAKEAALRVPEILNGVKDEPHTKGLEMNTSPGHGWCGPGKKKYFENTETGWKLRKTEEANRFATEAKRRIQIYAAGRRPIESVWKVSKKDEIVKPSKILTSNTRTFACPDLPYQYICKMLTGRFTNAFLDPHNSGMKRNRSATGMSMPELFRELGEEMAESPLFFGVDFKAYDATIPAETIELLAEFIVAWYRHWYRPTEKHVNAIRSIILEGMASNSIFESFFFHNNGAENSGFPNGLTIILNWFHQMMMFCYAYCVLTGRDPDSYWYDVQQESMGDDGFVFLRDPSLAATYNRVTIAELVKDELGMEMTSSDKDVALTPFDNYENAEFMSHFFRPCEYYPSILLPALKKPSIWKLLAFWKITTDLGAAGQIESNIQDALAASAGWGRPFFREVRDFIVQHESDLMRASVEVRIPSFESILVKYYEVEI